MCKEVAHVLQDKYNEGWHAGIVDTVKDLEQWSQLYDGVFGNGIKAAIERIKNGGLSKVDQHTSM